MSAQQVVKPAQRIFRPHNVWKRCVEKVHLNCKSRDLAGSSPRSGGNRHTVRTLGKAGVKFGLVGTQRRPKRVFVIRVHEGNGAHREAAEKGKPLLNRGKKFR